MQSSLITSLSLVALLCASGCREDRPQPASAPGSAAPAASPGSAAAHGSAALPPGNVVQTEMRLMTSILEATIQGIGAMDVRSIEHELHGLHEAKEATTAAVRAGTYQLPKNADQVAAFEAMDEAFHQDLAKLVAASRKNDVAGAADALGAIVRGCHGCHTTFRPAP